MRLLNFLFFFGLSVYAQEGVWYKSLDKALENPSQVYQLQLKRKGLTSFPTELSLFPNLVKLDLSKNKIEAFPDSLSFLSKLTVLNLSRNDISIIPVHITQLEALEHLDLWDNYVDEIPESILGLKNLYYIDIRGVAVSYERYNEFIKMMEGVNLFMSEPCDCQE